MPKIVAVGGCAALFIAGTLFAVENAEPVKITKTEQMDFPSGGLLHLNDVIGDLTIEPWDQPGIEITTTKSTKADLDSQNHEKGVAELDQVHIAAQRKGNELTLTTEFPRYGHFLFVPGHTRFDLDTHISVPRNTRLDIHGSGQIYLNNLASDIQAEISHGTIVLHLPEQGHYDIDARSKFGTVESDFPGQEKRSHWIGHSFTDQPATGAQKLYLRTGYGDVILLKIRQPQAPPAVKPES